MRRGVFPHAAAATTSRPAQKTERPHRLNAAHFLPGVGGQGCGPALAVVWRPRTAAVRRPPQAARPAPAAPVPEAMAARANGLVLEAAGGRASSRTRPPAVAIETLTAIGPRRCD